MRYKKDILRYKEYSKSSALLLVLTQQGLWALFVYRFFNAIYRSTMPKIVKAPLLVVGVFFQKWIEVITGITLPYAATIGEGLYIGHYSGIIISPETVIGKHCNISQGVTIGVSGRGAHRGVPTIGNRVYMAAGAVIAGGINVGDAAVIGANSLVITDVKEGTTVIGVPAKMVSAKDSKGYI